MTAGSAVGHVTDCAMQLVGCILIFSEQLYEGPINRYNGYKPKEKFDYYILFALK